MSKPSVSLLPGFPPSLGSPRFLREVHVGGEAFRTQMAALKDVLSPCWDSDVAESSISASCRHLWSTDAPMVVLSELLDDALWSRNTFALAQLQSVLQSIPSGISLSSVGATTLQSTVLHLADRADSASQAYCLIRCFSLASDHGTSDITSFISRLSPCAVASLAASNSDALVSLASMVQSGAPGSDIALAHFISSSPDTASSNASSLLPSLANPQTVVQRRASSWLSGFPALQFDPVCNASLAQHSAAFRSLLPREHSDIDTWARASDIDAQTALDALIGMPLPSDTLRPRDNAIAAAAQQCAIGLLRHQSNFLNNQKDLASKMQEVSRRLGHWAFTTSRASPCSVVCARLLHNLMCRSDVDAELALSCLSAALDDVANGERNESGESQFQLLASTIAEKSAGACASNDGADALIGIMRIAAPACSRSARKRAAKTLRASGLKGAESSALVPDALSSAGDDLMHSCNNDNESISRLLLALRCSLCQLADASEKELKKACDGVSECMRTRSGIKMLCNLPAKLMRECSRRIRSSESVAIAQGTTAGMALHFQCVALLRSAGKADEMMSASDSKASIRRLNEWYRSALEFKRAVSDALSDQQHRSSRLQSLKRELLEGGGSFERAKQHQFVQAIREDDAEYESADDDPGYDLADFIVCGVPNRDYREYIRKRPKLSAA